MSDQQPAPAGRSAAKTGAVYAAVLILTVVVASSLTLLVARWLSAPQVQPVAQVVAAGPARAAAPGVTAPAPGATTPAPSSPAAAPGPAARFDVSPPVRLFAGNQKVSTATGLDVSLPPQRYRAVLLQVSLQGAIAPTGVSVRSDTEVVPAVNVPAAGGSSSATVVVQPGKDGALQVRLDGGGGQLTVDRIGIFTTAASSAAGRIIALRADEVLHLIPKADGKHAVLDFASSQLPQETGSVSAVLLRVAGEVGRNGGYVKVGPGYASLNQAVYWGATTASNDLIRYGFMVVPLYRNGVHLEYHAGTELNVDLVGYVTGSTALTSTDGLSVPVAAQDVPGVRVTAAGPQPVSLIPATGLAGVTPEQVSAAMVGVSVQGAAPGAVSLSHSGQLSPRFADVAPGPRAKRMALSLAPVAGGTVTVTSAADASVVLTPRVLILHA